VRRWRGVAHWLARWVAAAVLATCAVDIVLLPVTAQAFGRVTVAGIVLNLLALPLMALVQVSGMCVVALDALGLPAGWPGSVARSAASALVDSARLVEWIPWSARLVPPPGATLIGVYYAACALAVWGRGRLRAVGIVVLVVSVLAVWVGIPLDAGSWRNAAARVAGLTAPQRSLDWLEPPLRLTMFDVGQAESVLVQPPGGGAMLVDTGGSPFGGERFDIGRLVLAPALRARGVYALDALLVTHGDPDHIGGARSMLDRLGVGQVLLGILVPGHEPSRALVAHARERNVAVRDWRAGQTNGLGGVRVRVLHPPEPDWERRRIRNDDSVVVEIVHGDVAVLLTGDVSSEVERAILPQLSAARTRVLKVAHHGSRTSTSSVILEGWRPQTALISCGRGNLFGHPAPEVLARLARIGARVYRTDRDGEITLESDGREVRVRTALSGPT
jgi:competence protein ComEC